MNRMRPINVLSLFDGMSCGQIALRRAGIPVASYYASEIDKHAIKVAVSNFPATVQIGDVTNVSGHDAPVSIDLLLAGSPCQGFSFLGKQLAYDDPRSALYFEFLRIKRETNPTYWLLENVRMKCEHQDVITEGLGVEPVMINSKLVSAQSRPRLYWTNIPRLTVPGDRGIVTADIIDYADTSENTPGWNKWWERNAEYQLRTKYAKIINDHDKASCLTTRQVRSWNGNLVRNPNGSLRFVSPLECERLQTVPEGYTNAASRAQAYKMLGNGWTVDVIAHILRGIIPW